MADISYAQWIVFLSIKSMFIAFELNSVLIRTFPKTHETITITCFALLHADAHRSWTSSEKQLL